MIEQKTNSNPHIPQILIKKFKEENKKSFNSEAVDNEYYFNAVIMVIDISGFTNLSVRASLDELKDIVNNYFSFLLDVIAEFKGDVIKFAGDALQVVWPIENEDPVFVISIALECALQINRRLSFIRVFFDNMKNIDVDSKNGSETPQLHYELSIHSGMAMGKVLAIDLFENKRREYFIAGEAVIDSFKAVNLATPGALVMTNICYNYISRQNSIVNISTEPIDRHFVKFSLISSNHSPTLNLEFNTRSSMYTALDITIDSSESDLVYEYLHEAIRPDISNSYTKRINLYQFKKILFKFTNNN